MGIEIRRSGSRFVTTAPGRATRHSFSFGSHYDPANIGFGLLLAHNDDRVSPGNGYDDHPHRDTEIVTWVLEGALVHRDSEGRSGVITPGVVQVMSAGSGIVHAETVAVDAPATRFVQTWVRPDSAGGAPKYSAASVSLSGSWLPVASGAHLDAATRIDAAEATLWIASPASGQHLALPEVPRAHLFVASGSVMLQGAAPAGPVELSEGDAARLAGSSGDLLTVVDDAHLMLWTFDR